MKMPLRKREPECGRIEKIRQAVQSRAADAGHRVRDEFGDRAPTFDQVKATVADSAPRVRAMVVDNAPKMRAMVTDNAPKMRAMVTDNAPKMRAMVSDNAPKMRAMVADNAPKVRVTVVDAAHTVSDAAQIAAQQAAVAASAAAHTAVERSRPLRTEAASRGTAAWTILRHGAAPASHNPLRKAMALGAVSAPAAAGKVGTAVKKKSNSAVGMMAAGGVGAMAILWYRRSRANAEAAWITDADPVAGAPSDSWHESAPVAAGSTGRVDKPAECADPETCRDPAHTWP